MTADAKRIAADNSGGSGGVKRHKTFHDNLARSARVPVARTYASRGKVVARSKEKIQYGDVSAIVAGFFLEVKRKRAPKGAAVGSQAEVVFVLVIFGRARLSNYAQLKRQRHSELDTTTCLPCHDFNCLFPRLLSLPSLSLSLSSLLSLQVDIDLGGVEQLVETSQTRAVADALDCLARTAMTRKLPMAVRARGAQGGKGGKNPRERAHAYAPTTRSAFVDPSPGKPAT